MVPLQRALVTSYSLALHNNFSSIFTHFRYTGIAAFVLQHITFPTPPLVSSKFPHVPLAVALCGWPLGYEERRCWAIIVRVISFQDCQPTVCAPDPPTSQTDRQTDRRHQSINQ